MSLSGSQKNKLVDLEFLKTRKEIADTMLHDLLEVFNLEVPILIAELKLRYRSNSQADIRDLGHKLKGMSQNMGAVYLGKLAEKIEQGNPDIIRPLIDCLDSAYEETREILADFVTR